MNTHTENTIHPKIIIASLWIAMLFIYAYVDIFSLFRADILAAALDGKVFLFDASQMFFFLTTLFITIPCLMVPLSLITSGKLNKVLNIVIPLLYIIATIGGAVGETWIYYIFGSVIEVILLLLIIAYAWKMPVRNPTT